MKIASKITDLFSDRIWTLDTGGSGRVYAELVRIVKLIRITFNEFAEQKMGFQCVALSYFSALAIVPFAAFIFAVGGGYQFDKIFGLNAAAAWNTKKDMGYNGSKRSWQVEATFGKEDRKKAGNVTGYIAYRHLGNSVSWRPDYEVMNSGQKGWDFGVKYVIYKDIVASLRYFNGKAIKDGTESMKKSL